MPNQGKILEGQWGIFLKEGSKIRYFLYEKGVRGAYYLNEYLEEGKGMRIDFSYGKKDWYEIKTLLEKNIEFFPDKTRFLKAV